MLKEQNQINDDLKNKLLVCESKPKAKPAAKKTTSKSATKKSSKSKKRPVSQ
jgi:hypothetical protein